MRSPTWYLESVGTVGTSVVAIFCSLEKIDDLSRELSISC